MATFITRMIDVMKQKGWKQCHLVELTGLSAGAISKMCTGGTEEPNTRSRRLIAQALGVSEDYLRFGTNTPPRAARKAKVMKTASAGNEIKAEEVKIAPEPAPFSLPAGSDKVAVVILPADSVSQLLRQIGR